MVTVDGWRLLVGNPVAELSTLAELDRYAEAVDWRGAAPDGPPFRTAAVGWLTDGLNASLLHVPPDVRPQHTDLPAVSFGVYDWTVAVAPDGQGWIVAEAGRLPALREWVRQSEAPPQAPAPEPRTATCGLSPPAHARAVEQILEWIAAGDLYQANLTFQVAVPWAHSPQDLARRLTAATPGAAHEALLVTDDAAVVSVSPETFLRISGGQVTTRPVKGTRPRGATAAADDVAAAQLRASAKDHAEHLMIVDLERNDLGRVCDPGSVVVDEYAALEGHPTVWHLTSTVRGRLRQGVVLSDVLSATFPPGSVTGTPKRMAVSRTTRLEPIQRGVYCGAIGLVAPGVVDLSVAIRTAVVANDTARYGTGGGIVADSSAEAEYAEGMAKAAAFLRATNAVVTGTPL